MWPLSVLCDSAWRPLTWTLVHFLWPGIFVAALWQVLFRLCRPCRTQTHYVLGLAGLLVMAACPVVTLLLIEADSGWPYVPAGHETAVAESTLPPATGSGALLFGPGTGVKRDGRSNWSNGSAMLSRICSAAGPLVWCVLGGRLLFGAVGVYRLGRGRRPVSDELGHRAAVLARKMGLAKVPGVFVSAAVREALVVGFLRPMVLLPAAWLAEMPVEVLEAVLAHELAHIRRFDLWVNLFQRFLETLLFYHPAVWWLSHRVRLAREMCCDELAAAATGERVVYASALELAAQKRLVPARSFLEVALGVTRMTLLTRVRNVLGLAAQSERGRWWPAAVLALLVPASVWLASTAALTSAQEKKPAAEAKTAGDQKGASSAARRTYTATALFQVRFDTPSLAAATSAGEQGSARDRFEIYKCTQRELLLSRFVLSAALRDPKVVRLPSIRQTQKTGDAVARLKGRLRVTFPGQAEIMEVSLTADDPEEAATLVQAVADSYLREVVNTEVDKKRARLRELDRAVADKVRDIRARREELKKLAARSGTSATENLTEKQKAFLEELFLCRHQLAQVQAELRRAKMDLAVQQSQLKSVEAMGMNEAEADALKRQDPIGRQLSVELGWKKLDQLYMDTSVIKGTNPRYVEPYRQAIKTLQESYDARKSALADAARQKRRAPIQAEVRRLEKSVAVLTEQQRALQ